MADMDTLEKPLKKYKKRKKTGDEDAKKIYPVLKKVYDTLSQGQIAYELKDEMTPQEIEMIKEYNLLTFKPFVYALNIGEDQLSEADQIKQEFEERLDKPVQVVCARLEEQMLEFDEQDKQDYLGEITNGDVPTLDDLIKLAFDTVGLMYYFTTGEKETKAWTIKKGSTAPQAAGQIHSDFEEGFIKAEVIQYQQLMEDGGWKEAKENGNMRLE